MANMFSGLDSLISGGADSNLNLLAAKDPLASGAAFKANINNDNQRQDMLAMLARQTAAQNALEATKVGNEHQKDMLGLLGQEGVRQGAGAIDWSGIFNSPDAAAVIQDIARQKGNADIGKTVADTVAALHKPVGQTVVQGFGVDPTTKQFQKTATTTKQFNDEQKTSDKAAENSFSKILNTVKATSTDAKRKPIGVEPPAIDESEPAGVNGTSADEPEAAPQFSEAPKSAATPTKTGSKQLVTLITAGGSATAWKVTDAQGKTVYINEKGDSFIDPNTLQPVSR